MLVPLSCPVGSSLPWAWIGVLGGRGCPLCTCLEAVVFVTEQWGSAWGGWSPLVSSVVAGQLFEAALGMAETGCGLRCRWRAGSVTVHCRWAVMAQIGPSGAQTLLLDFEGRGWGKVQFEFCIFGGSSVVFLASQFLHVSEAYVSPRPWMQSPNLVQLCPR